MKSAASHSELDSSAFDYSDFAVAAGLAVIAAIVIVPGLGVQSLANWDEAIYGVVTRELLAHAGLTLRYGERLWFEKPPFAFWLMAASSSVFGLTEFALRLPSALFGIAAIVLQYLAGRRLGGRSAGLLAAILLLGVPQFVAYSRLAMTDVPLSTLGMLSVVLLLYADRRPSLMMSAGAAFGLAILTKSVAAFLFIPGLLAIVTAQHGIRFLHSKEMWLAIIAAVAVALPWHACLAVIYGRSFLDQYFGFHVVARFLSPLEGHEGSSLYYLETYFNNAGFLAPVQAAGIALAVGLAIVKRDRLLAAASILPLAAFAMVSLQGTKIGGYLTPVSPAAALAAAVGIMRFVHGARGRVAVLLLASLLALPGIVNGRGRFVESADILDFSPEVRSLRDTEVFANGRVSVLYTFGLAEPALRFYLADHVQSIGELELARLFARDRPFLCLTFNSQVAEFARKHPDLQFEIIASTESLALIGYL
ncbi:MAG TPA: glycosyltransferase family 39 protein [Candidatus Binatia bacterium]|nr:glycosyltransferase family 39 protein [Candidatus Binatia bacterium]